MFEDSHYQPTGPRGPEPRRRGPGQKAQGAQGAQESQEAQEAREAQRSAEDVATAVRTEACRWQLAPSEDLLHSLLAQREDGSMLAFAITGSLDAIARELTESWGVHQAFVLDNGGSVGWMSCLRGSDQGTTLVAGPNHRPAGLAFLDLWPASFVHPRGHAKL